MKPRKTLAERYWPKVEVREPDECWPWLGNKHDGYGVLGARGEWYTSNRVTWLLINGPIPDGLWVLHTCDNRACVNPAHLYLGTNKENVADRERRHRRIAARGEAHGHCKLTSAQVLEIREALDSERAIGLRFGISKGHVHKIKKKLAWRHL
jgi:HNH endonuclease